MNAGNWVLIPPGAPVPPTPPPPCAAELELHDDAGQLLLTWQCILSPEHGGLHLSKSRAGDVILQWQ